jgi:hypothetical protein
MIRRRPTAFERDFANLHGHRPGFAPEQIVTTLRPSRWRGVAYPGVRLVLGSLGLFGVIVFGVILLGMVTVGGVALWAFLNPAPL